MHDICQGYLLANRQLEYSLIDSFLCHDQLSQGIRIRDNENIFSLRQTSQDLSSQDLIGSIFLPILDGSTITRWKEEHILLSQSLHQVMIKITSLISILKHEKYRLLELWVYGSKKDWCGRTHQSLQENGFQQFFLY